ncbi:hypothetical protein ACIPWF_10350 [Paenarthrobacter sp. NPDC089989]|uniref:hypothetical protein n=1 Tax=unclassified Paenarthrobacter TaxID=2634190 RepID=UPI003801BBB2
MARPADRRPVREPPTVTSNRLLTLCVAPQSVAHLITPAPNYKCTPTHIVVTKVGS